MQMVRYVLLIAVMGLVASGLSACATQEEITGLESNVTQLEQEFESLRSRVNEVALGAEAALTASREAQAAADAARKAAETAAEASARMEAVLNKSMRK